MAAPLYQTESGRLWHAGQIILVTVGLPARGKTHISRSLERYLRWLGVKTAVFSLGDYRRKIMGGAKSLPPDYFGIGAKSPETQALRSKIKEGLEQQALDFFQKEGGQVVIYDANNGVRATRYALRAKFEALGIHVVFLESMCDRDDIVEANIRSVKLSSPDYKGWDADKAVKDYWSRIRDQEKFYEPIIDPDVAWIKVVNVGERIVINRIEGYLQSRIIFFLMNIHNRPRTIYFARSGQSLIEHSYKADSDLSPAGWEYAESLKEAVMSRRRQVNEDRRNNGEKVDEDRKLVVWTSARRRAYHTAWPFVRLDYRVEEKPQMGEINPGVWDGLSSDEARSLYPDEWERFLKDPYAHRAPRAESYHDLSVRLEPVIFELERCQEDLLIIGHASVIRCLLAYLVGLPPNEVPSVEIARGDLVEVVPASYGVLSRAFHFWSGPGRADGETGMNLYENVAEATQGKGVVVMEHIFPAGPQDINVTPEDIASAEAEEEAAGEGKTERDPLVLRDLMLDREDAMSRPSSTRGYARAPGGSRGKVFQD
ncbi:6-phosphofructo-2-kinase-domain-containing protein [Mrakia frigida]|uniref:bifunctional nucleoside/nucleotide kinase/histidine phosphatase family protein n=1 Tax=Mrakia frigida TaxID=29902 RepID=UPI003FCBF907